jgi:hypothetical protein
MLCPIRPRRSGWGGVPRLRHAERGQIEWRPFSLDQLVPEGHRVRLVWRFVEGLDLTPLLARIKAVEGHAGHAAADPRILMGLWLYATVTGIGSARELARLCKEHVAFRWLCGGVSMNAKTLADSHNRRPTPSPQAASARPRLSAAATRQSSKRPPAA